MAPSNSRCSIGPMKKGIILTTLLVGTSTYITSVADLDAIGFMGVVFSLLISAWMVLSFLRIIWDSLLGPALGFGVNFRKMGKWAVVTGATDGIGLAYSKQLAAMGLNIVLISRTKERLDRVARQIETKYKVKTKVVQVDFAQHMEQYDKLLEDELSGMDIGTVINNVGMTYERPSYFHDVCNNATFVTSMINLNVVAVTAMTRILLPKMLEREKGVFVNVGSAVSYIGVPFFSLYSASKCYMEELTLDLAEEYADKGIIFQYQAPGYVTTKIAKIKETSFGIPNPEQYARAGLRSVGLQQATSIWPSQRLFAAAGSVLLTIGGKELLRSMAYSVGYTFWLYAKKREIEKTKFDNVV